MHYISRGVVLVVNFHFKTPGSYNYILNNITISDNKIVIDLNIEKAGGNKKNLAFPILFENLSYGEYQVILIINGDEVLTKKIIVEKFRPMKHIRGFQIFNTGVITIAVPIRPSMPLYLWWYNYDNSTVYVGRYYGIGETWLWKGTKFRSHFMFNESMDFS